MSEEKNDIKNQDTSNNDKSLRKSKKPTLITILVILLIFGAITGIYLWRQQEINKLQSQNNELNEKISLLEKNASIKVDDEETDEPSNTEYAAEVGKFTLTLPNKYNVIEIQDGGGEGGPATILQLGDITDESGVIESYGYDQVYIRSYPLQSLTYQEHVDSRLNDSSARKQNTNSEIDGISTDTYTIASLGEIKKVFFTKGDLFYAIELSDNTESANEKLDAIVAGFKFN